MDKPSVLEIFVEYFHQNRKFDYSWKKLNYSATIKKKKDFKKQWDKASSIQEKIRISKDIVAVWGGIKSNSDETLKEYVKEISSDNPAKPLKGIASYSKIYSVVRPEKYVIYDSRVAVALNAVQMIYKSEKAIHFHYAPSRNKLINNFIQEFEYSNKYGWTLLKPNDTYAEYLALIEQLKQLFPEKEMYDFEMQLFHEANILCEKAKIISTDG